MFNPQKMKMMKMKVHLHFYRRCQVIKLLLYISSGLLKILIQSASNVSSNKLLSLFLFIILCHHDNWQQLLLLCIKPIWSELETSSLPCNTWSHLSICFFFWTKRRIFECLLTILFSRTHLRLCMNSYHPTTHTQPPPAPPPRCINATEPQIMVSRSWS